MDTPLETLNARIFAGQLHTRFKTQVDTNALELELAEVEERDGSPVELFFLRFRGPRTPRLAQQIYRLEHEKLGTLSIFLTAVSADQSGIYYESVFNRMRQKDLVSG